MTGTIGRGLSGRLSWDDAGRALLTVFALFFALRFRHEAFAYAGAALSLWSWAASRRRYRQIADVPTARLASAPQGQVELSGKGDSLSEYPVLSPITGMACLWFDFSVETGNGDSRRITRQGTSTLPFALRDLGQSVMVMPEGAQVITRHRQTWRRGNETFTESVLLKDETLYVLGEYVHDWVESDSYSLDKQAGALLQQWKDDQDALHRRFDADGNGIIDQNEWQLARQQAEKEAMADMRIGLNNARQCIRQPKHGGSFIISNYSAAQLAARFRRWSWLHLGLFFAALMIAVGL